MGVPKAGDLEVHPLFGCRADHLCCAVVPFALRPRIAPGLLLSENIFLFETISYHLVQNINKLSQVYHSVLTFYSCGGKVPLNLPRYGQSLKPVFCSRVVFLYWDHQKTRNHKRQIFAERTAWGAKKIKELRLSS